MKGPSSIYLPLTALLALTQLLAGTEAQSTVSYVTTIAASVFPGGISTGSTRQESTVPLACLDGCFYFAAPYSYCFLFGTLPNGTASTGVCDTLCNQTYFDGLSSCLNCIVANGGEKPFGYSTNTSITAFPSRTATPPIGSALGSATSSYRPSPADLQNPNGVIDVNQANGWLRNMTNLCAARGTTLSGAASVTATATTTGPYATSWTRGETIVRTQWTGLTQYSAPVATLTRTVFAISASGQPSRQSAGEGPSTTSSLQSSGSSVSGAAASQSSRAAGIESVQWPAGLMWGGGALLAWAVL